MSVGMAGIIAAHTLYGFHEAPEDGQDTYSESQLQAPAISVRATQS